MSDAERHKDEVIEHQCNLLREVLRECIDQEALSQWDQRNYTEAVTWSVSAAVDRVRTDLILARALI